MKKIITLGDIRDQRAHEEAKQLVNERHRAIREALMRLARCEERYQVYGGAVHRLARMKAAKELRGTWRR